MSFAKWQNFNLVTVNIRFFTGKVFVPWLTKSTSRKAIFGYRLLVLLASILVTLEYLNAHIVSVKPLRFE